MARWLLPEPKDFLMYYPPFVEVFGGKAFEHESAYYIEGYAGVALWLPPNIEPDEEKMMSYIEKVTHDDKKKRSLRPGRADGSLSPRRTLLVFAASRG